MTRSHLIMCCQLFTLALLALFLSLVSSQEPTQTTERSVNQTGQLGNPGQPSVDEGDYMTGILLAKHSQTDIVPDCHPGHKKLWDGYSFMDSMSNGMAHTQDLGTAGSCIRKFSTMPFLFCDLKDDCKYAYRDDSSYWLSTNAPIPVLPLEESSIKEHISRCVVCEVPANVIAVHSQSTAVPDCPAGWNSLWIGYSFIMRKGQESLGGGQGLASPGSCLEDFRAEPSIQCNVRGSCHYYFGNELSFWLATIEDRDQFVVPRRETLMGNNMLKKVSRCTVCIRTI